MISSFWRVLAVVVAMATAAAPALAQEDPQAPAEARFGFVIGNDAYENAALPTAANDAALVADALRAAGFDVTGARNLDQDTLRSSYREFLEKVAAAGPGAVAAVYLSGYGVQSEGENYLVPPGARVAREADLALNAVRLSDFTRALAGLPGRAGIFMFDVAYPGPFANEGVRPAPGLALVEPDPGMLIGFNAAPGAVAAVPRGAYGPYAQAIAEMIREAGLPVDDVFARVRTRVVELTKGAQAPWHESRIEPPLILLERGADAPAPAITAADMEARRNRPLREMSVAEAYAAALDRDTLRGYQEFLEAYPDSGYAKNVRNMIATRREAITWARTTSANTANAYWSYLKRYPKGPHAGDARRRLARLAAAVEPPTTFEPLDYSVGPPSDDEIVWLEDDRRVFVEIEAPIDDYIAPPPRWWRPPPPPVFDDEAYYFLPAPVEVVETPVWVRRPRYLASPPPPVWYEDRKPSASIAPYVAIPAALAAGIVAGKLIKDRRDRRRDDAARPGRPPARAFLPPVSAPARVVPATRPTRPGERRIAPVRSEARPDQPGARDIRRDRRGDARNGAARDLRPDPKSPQALPAQRAQPERSRDMRRPMQPPRVNPPVQRDQTPGVAPRQPFPTDRQSRPRRDRPQATQPSREAPSPQQQMRRRSQPQQIPTERQPRPGRDRPPQLQQQMQQQRQQRMQQQRQQQMQQQMQQQRQQQMQQQRQQQMQQQRQQQMQQQRQQQMQQQRQQQMQQQRQQQMQQRQQRPQPDRRGNCGRPGQPPCR